MAHLPAVAADPRAALAAVAEPDEAKRARAVSRFEPWSAHADWADMLAETELDAVVVATPPGGHFAPAAAALAGGLHVLVEKPMTIAPAEADELCRLASATGAELSVGYTFQHTPHAIRLRDEIARGRIGRVEHVSCQFASIARELYRGTPEAYDHGETGFAMTETPGASTYSTPGSGGGGQAHSQLTHSAALALHLSGAAPRRVAAVTSAFELPVDLADALAVELDGGALAAFDSVGSVLPGQDEILQCRVFGDEGHVQLDAIAGRASIHGAGGAVEELSPLTSEDAYPLHEPARNLVGLALGEAPNRAPGLLGAQVVHLLDAALRSAADGRAVELA
jgi:predicted dehydrogenase